MSHTTTRSDRRRFGGSAVAQIPLQSSCRGNWRDAGRAAFWRQSDLKWRHPWGRGGHEPPPQPARRPIATRLVVLLLTALLPACSWPAADDLPATIAWVEERHPGVRHVDPGAVHTGDDGLLLFDVRQRQEYAVSHLDGSLHWVDLPTALARIAERRPRRVILYCSVGERSSRAAARLQAARPDLPIANLRGGIFAWAIAGLPLVDQTDRAVTRVHPYDARWGRLLPESLRHSGDPP